MGGPTEFGTYLVYEELGSGAMASVHRAETRGAAGFRKAIALKRLHPQLATNEELVQAFINEARLASYLKHGNIVQTYDFGKVDDAYFIAMELARGPTLKQLIRQCVSAAGAMPLPVAIHVVIQICEALDHAHNLSDEHGKPLGIVHRDVSPSNVIIDNSGIVKLIDFGIAKVKSRNVQTQAGTIKGKFGYIAPEYLAGQIDARADLFAVGVLTHELLTSRQLFTAENEWETLSKVREMPIQPPSRWNPSIPTELDHIVLTALQRDPSLRWQNAGALRNALGGVLREMGVVVSNKDIADWVMWAFSQRPRNDDSAVVRLIDELEPSVSVEIVRDVSSPALDVGAATARDPAASWPDPATLKRPPVAQMAAAPRAFVTTLPRNTGSMPAAAPPSPSPTPMASTTAQLGASPPTVKLQVMIDPPPSSMPAATTAYAPPATSPAPQLEVRQHRTTRTTGAQSGGVPAAEMPASISDATVELVPTTVRQNPMSLFPQMGGQPHQKMPPSSRPGLPGVAPSPREVADAMLGRAQAPGKPVELRSLSSRLAAENPSDSHPVVAPAPAPAPAPAGTSAPKPSRSPFDEGAVTTRAPRVDNDEDTIDAAFDAVTVARPSPKDLLANRPSASDTLDTSFDAVTVARESPLKDLDPSATIPDGMQSPSATLPGGFSATSGASKPAHSSVGARRSDSAFDDVTIPRGPTRDVGAIDPPSFDGVTTPLGPRHVDARPAAAPPRPPPSASRPAAPSTIDLLADAARAVGSSTPVDDAAATSVSMPPASMPPPPPPRVPAQIAASAMPPPPPASRPIRTSKQMPAITAAPASMESSGGTRSSRPMAAAHPPAVPPSPPNQLHIPQPVAGGTVPPGGSFETSPQVADGTVPPGTFDPRRSKSMAAQPDAMRPNGGPPMPVPLGTQPLAPMPSNAGYPPPGPNGLARTMSGYAPPASNGPAPTNGGFAPPHPSMTPGPNAGPPMHPNAPMHPAAAHLNIAHPNSGVPNTALASQSSGVVLEHKLPVKRPMAPQRKVSRAWIVLVILLLLAGGAVAAYFLIPEFQIWCLENAPW